MTIVRKFVATAYRSDTGPLEDMGGVRLQEIIVAGEGMRIPSQIALIFNLRTQQGVREFELLAGALHHRKLLSVTIEVEEELCTDQRMIS